MHSDVRVAKEAQTQLRKVNSWVAPALEIEGMEEELQERWEALFSEIMDALSSFLEGSS